ncbi:MAG: helix-turn-helix transcriptional regulator [Pseudomonadota bacterium]
MTLRDTFPTAPDSVGESSIGERIRTARKDLGLNQAGLARRVGVSQPSVANWESGMHDPRRLMITKIAAVLGVSPDWLAGGARSHLEEDKHPAAAYLRRNLIHTPIISLANAGVFLTNPNADPHTVAEDYIPITTRAEKVFAFFSNDPAIAAAFPTNTLIVIDYADRRPADGVYCLYATQTLPVLRCWREKPARLEPAPTSAGYRSITEPDPDRLIGRARVSIRFH